VLLNGDDERSAQVLDAWRLQVRAIVNQHQGVLLEAFGDTAVTGFERARDAIDAAITFRRCVREFRWPAGCKIGVRIAVHSGRLLARTAHPAGLPMFRLTRLIESAAPGQIVVSHATEAFLEGDSARTYSLRDLGERALTDFNKPAHVFEVVEQGLDGRELSR